MLLEPTGKELLIELCKRLNQLKLVVNINKKKGKWEESITFIFQEVIQNIVGKRINQVAPVQYVGGEKRILNSILTGVVLSLYS